jgi:hypothetical protein
MNNWFDWPHVHGAPVFAQLAGGPSILYVWPEKDHLKGFRWLGNRFDADHRILGSDQHGLLLAPPGPPAGMPGGMLAAVVDPATVDGGVVFASISRVPDQSKGILRALDPLTLREIWNNGNEDYKFAKFVSPTIAGTQLLLPTASGEVRVYGLR